MKVSGLAISLLFLASAHVHAAGPTPAKVVTNNTIFAGFAYGGDMDVEGGAELTIYPSKDVLRNTPDLAKNGGVIVVRNYRDVPRLLGLRMPEADGSEDNSCKGYTGIGVFELSQVKTEQEQDFDDETYTVVKGTLATATDIRVVHAECTGAAAEQKLLTE